MRSIGLFLVVLGWSALAASSAEAQSRSAEQAQIDKMMQEMNTRHMQRDFNVAEFYQRTNHLDAALYYYKLLCKRYPDTDYAKKAQSRIDELEDGNGNLRKKDSRQKQSMPFFFPSTPPQKIDPVPIHHPIERKAKEIAELRDQLKCLKHRLDVVEAKLNPVRVGEVIIVGNTKTPDEDIRKHFKFHPGEVLDFPLLRLAEVSLKKSGLFVVDPQKGIRPSVSVLDTDGPFKDILVKVQEVEAVPIR